MAGTYVQRQQGSATAASAQFISGSITSGSGNTGALVVTYTGATTTVAPDSVVGTWVEDTTLRHAAGGGVGMHVFTCDNLNAATSAITITFGASVTNRALFYIEASGIDHYIAGVFPAYQVTPGAANNAITSGNYTVSGASSVPNYLLGFCWDQTGGTTAPNLGSASSPQFTNVTAGWLFGGSINDMRVINGRALADGDVAATFTSSSGATDTYATILLAFAESISTYTLMAQCMY